MMQFMPLMFGFFFYGVSSGLVLYWLTSNVVGVAQQLGFNRFLSPDATVAEEAPVAKTKKRRAGKSR
jgi:YidC/Oxa1 family membrane protein insertase